MSSEPSTPDRNGERVDDALEPVGAANDASGGKRSKKRRRSEPETPRKRRRDSALVGYTSGLFTLLTLFAIVGVGALYWGKSTFDGAGPLQAETTVMINRNQGVGEIADNLARAGVISDANVFKAGVAAYGAKDKLRYGEYAFPAGVSMREAMEIIASGKSIEHAFTVPEGLTSLQIVQRLREEPLLTGDVKETPVEGSLLPETYKFTRGASREQMIARMREHQQETLERIWKGRAEDLRLKSPDELVILASLVEKETGVASERPQVAAVFTNRLARGMRLQSDPTIVYGLVGGRGTLGRSLTRSDILSKTPYNTYVVPGLPAGPIANPGREAMEATARPAKTKDLYFVADGSGGHAFAPSLVEHNRNVATWRKVEKARGAAADRLAPDEQTPEPPAGGDAGPQEAAATGGTPSTAAGASSTPQKPKTAAERAAERRRARDER